MNLCPDHRWKLNREGVCTACQLGIKPRPIVEQPQMQPEPPASVWVAARRRLAQWVAP